jgi:signal transduction histidine kinase
MIDSINQTTSAMKTPPTSTARPPNARHHKLEKKALYDLILVPLILIGSYSIAAFFNTTELFLSWAAQYEEDFNLDELPITLLSTTITLLWFAWRRWQETKKLLSQNHELLRHSMQVQEDERRRIAHDLHDDLGQYLNAIKADATSLLDFSNSLEETQALATRVISHSDHAYRATRQIMHHLRPVALDDLGLSAALNHLIDTWQSPQNIRNKHNQNLTKYSLKISSDIDHLNERVAINSYRIIQEAVTNATKHANASYISVNIENNHGTLKICIQDDGNGINPNALSCGEHASKGMGIAGMQERAESMNGDLTLSSALGLGTTITVTIPMQGE